MLDFEKVNWNLISKEVDTYFEKLFPINRSILSSGVLSSLKILQEITDFEIVEIPTGTACFDWTVPEEWSIEHAYISDLQGNIIIDFKDNNLHILNYSESVDKILKFSELENHLHYQKELPDAIPYKTSYFKKDWGFCLSYNQFKELDRNKDYQVKVKSTFGLGAIRIGECLIVGESTDEILISTYSCHPSLANDNLSGMILWTFLLSELKKVKKLKYSYRFVILPETIGAISYLSLNENKVKQNVKSGLVITTVAGPGRFGYKASFKGNDLVDRCVIRTFHENKINFLKYPFDINGSDERQYSSQLFRIPCCTITKDKYYEYKEYHTSLDNLDFVKAEYLVESLKLYLSTIQKIECSMVFFKSLNPGCEPFLRKRNLFSHLGLTKSNIIGLGNENNENILGEFENFDRYRDKILWLMFYCDGNMSLFEISEITNINLDQLITAAKILLVQKLLTQIN